MSIDGRNMEGDKHRKAASSRLLPYKCKFFTYSATAERGPQCMTFTSEMYILTVRKT